MKKNSIDFEVKATPGKFDISNLILLTTLNHCVFPPTTGRFHFIF